METRSRPYNEKRGCPPGFHKRSEYSSTRKHRVTPRCVRSTTVYKESSKEFKARTLKKQKRRLKMYVPSVKTLARKACPPGMIERKGYVRKYTSAVRKRGFTVQRDGKKYKVYPEEKSMYVAPSCVKNTGKPGKGVPRSIGPLRKGELAKHGYSFRASEDVRHRALRHAVEEFGPLGVFRKLDAVSKLTKLTVPEASKTYGKDRNWVESAYGPLKAFGNGKDKK